MESEIGEMQPQGRVSQEPLAGTRSQKKQKTESSPQPLEEAWPYQHLDFEQLASTNVRK